MKRLLLIFFLMPLIPSTSWSYTYEDVQNFLDNNPPPDGCYNWAEEVTTEEGTGYKVWQRCGSGRVIASQTSNIYSILLDGVTGGFRTSGTGVHLCAIGGLARQNQVDSIYISSAFVEKNNV